MTNPNRPTAPAGERIGTDTAARFGRLALVGIALYVVLDVVAQALPPHYNPVTQAESDLAVGPYGFVMTVNFVVRGLLSLALIAGLQRGVAPAARSRAGLVLVGVWAVGAFLLAIFPTDVGGHVTVHGAIHVVVALLAFVAGVVGEGLVAARLGADSRWAPLRLVLLVMAVVAAVVLVALIGGNGHAVARLTGSVFGLVERVFLGLVLLWMAVAAVRLTRLPMLGEGR
jgi:hypothetical protein